MRWVFVSTVCAPVTKPGGVHGRNDRGVGALCVGVDGVRPNYRKDFGVGALGVRVNGVRPHHRKDFGIGT